jgi:hypothetical protein
MCLDFRRLYADRSSDLMHAKPIMGSLQYLATPSTSSTLTRPTSFTSNQRFARQPSISAVSLGPTWRSMGLCGQNLNSGSLVMGKFL